MIAMPPKRGLKVVELQVSTKFTLPSLFEHADPSEIEQALTLGALVCETVMAAKASAEFHEIMTKKQAELDHTRQQLREAIEQAAEQSRMAIEQMAIQSRESEQKTQEAIAHIKAQTNKKVAELQAEIDASEDARKILVAKHAKDLKDLQDAQKADEGKIRQAERELTTHQLNQRLQQLQTEIHIANEKNAGLLQRKSQLEETRDADIRAAQDRAIALLKPAMEEKDRAIARAQETIRAHDVSYANLADTIRQLTEGVTRRSTNAKIKGNEFEGNLRELLIKYFGTNPRFKLTDTALSGFGHAGDIVMHWMEEKILWEGKDYSDAVPTAEVEKFRRDMRENADIRVGVMISKHSAITGMTERGDMRTEFIGHQMLIYISRFQSFDDKILQLLMELFHVHWASSVEEEKDESKEAAIRQIEELYNKSQRDKKEWRNQKARMQEGLQFISEIIDTNEDVLHRALANLRAGTGAKEHDVPTSIFRATFGNPKDDATIQILLKEIVAKEGASIALNDLADILAKRKALSRDVAKTHIKAVLQDSVFETMKGKTTMLRGLEFVAKSDESLISHS